MRFEQFDQSVFEMVNQNAKLIENHLKADVVFYNGPIYPELFRGFRNFIETVRKTSDRTDNAVAVFLRTAGGSAETTEKMVQVLRKHFNFVYFVVPDFAMSAGTIFCMSGDKIFMDYSSSLGPIDPQVPSTDTGDYVPALGYLDKISEITQKKSLVPADVVFLKSIDLAKLALFEQARDLSVDLLKKWLVEYKFKDWTKHRTTNPGTPVTHEQKLARAETIAKALSNHKKWRSHGRSLDIQKLQELKIDIDDYSDNKELYILIRKYNDDLTGWLDSRKIPYFLHNHRVQPQEDRT